MHWYLIYTYCWHEKKVKRRLERERFKTFLPLVEHTPLFPGYLFVRTGMSASIYLKILRIKGVIALFCSGGKPAIIPDQQVDTIRKSLNNSKDVKPCYSRGGDGGRMAAHRILPQPGVTSAPQHQRN